MGPTEVHRLHETFGGDPRLPRYASRRGGDASLRELRGGGGCVRPLAFETPFSLTFFVSGFTCEDLRGEPGNDLFILNHFLTRTIGHPSFAELVNFDPFFVERARECEAFHGRIPNFVTVDYHEIGDVFEVVAALNGLDGLR